MTEEERNPHETPYVDRRPRPTSGLPRGIQTWLMLGGAILLLLLIALYGHPQPTTPVMAGTVAAPPRPDVEGLRSFQTRIDGIRPAPLQADPSLAPRMLSSLEPVAAPSQAAEDPLAQTRREREYNSLFAGNLVLSRRPDQTGRVQASPAAPTTTEDEAPFQMPTLPSNDELAQSVVKAMGLTAQSPNAVTPPPVASQPAVTPSRDPLHRVFEGTFVEAVLTNELDGVGVAPVIAQVTYPVYAQDGVLVIPDGARVLGTTKQVNSFGDEKLAVAFHRLLLPNGQDVNLNQFVGLNQIGDAGLRGHVNRHYLSTFGAAAAVGLISGLSQAVGSSFTHHDGDNNTVVVAGSVGDATTQAAMSTMQHFLNRLPTITIPPGKRIKVYIAGDLDLPAYREER